MFLASLLVTLLVAARGFLLQRSHRFSIANYAAVDDKVEVSEYFNNEGFKRWNKVANAEQQLFAIMISVDLLGYRRC